MILSVSRRTDIPAFYSEWFYNRLKEGFCYTQNPMNSKQISKVKLSPDVLDAIVFWTKNPKPMLKRLDEVKFPFYFQFTINAYNTDIEAHVPEKKNLIETFQELSDKIGADRIIWRYDPILLNKQYTIDYHIKYFEILAKNLHKHTNKVIISYIDFYKKISKNWNSFGLFEINLEEKEILAKALSDIAHAYGLSIDSCSEDIDLEKYNINHARCIDDRLLTKILSTRLNIVKDTFQRLSCGCVQSVDIGIYNTCRNGCKYCYASFSENSVQQNISKHSPRNPLLLGEVPDNVEIKEKAQKSIKDMQTLLY